MLIISILIIDEIVLRRITGVVHEFSSAELQKTTFNQASDEFELLNDHQSKIPQEKDVANTNDDQFNQNQDENPLGPSLMWNKNHLFVLVISNPTEPLRTRDKC